MGIGALFCHPYTDAVAVRLDLLIMWGYSHVQWWVYVLVLWGFLFFYLFYCEYIIYNVRRSNVLRWFSFAFAMLKIKDVSIFWRIFIMGPRSKFHYTIRRHFVLCLGYIRYLNGCSVKAVYLNCVPGSHAVTVLSRRSFAKRLII